MQPRSLALKSLRLDNIYGRRSTTTTTSYLRGKVGDVFFLALQGRLGHEAGEVAVLHAHLFDLCVDEFLQQELVL